MQIRRLFELVEKLQSGKDYNARQLAEEMGVSRRTMFRDLRSLEKLGVRAAYDEANQRYSISTSDELAQNAEILPSQLAAALGLQTGPVGKDDALATEPGNPFCLLANRNHSALGLPTSSVLKDLRIALRDQLQVELRLSDQSVVSAVPVNALQYGSIWVLVLIRQPAEATSDSLADPIAVQFSEIRSISIVSDESPFDTEPSVDALTSTAISTAAKHTLVLKLSASGHQLAGHGHQLPMQTIESRDGEVLLTAPVLEEDAVISWVLGFGHHAEVLEPLSIRTSISDHVAKLARTYSAPIESLA